MCKNTKICQYNYDNFKPESVCLICLSNLNRYNTIDSAFDVRMEDKGYKQRADRIYNEIIASLVK